MAKDFTEKLIEKDELHIVAELIIGEECDYFNGHFPQLKILPAVAQIDIVVRTAAKYFNTPICFRGAKRVKFSSVIQPDKLIRLEINYNAGKNSLLFSITDDSKTFSSGSLYFGES